MIAATDVAVPFTTFSIQGFLGVPCAESSMPNNTLQPNYRSALDAQSRLCFYIESHWPGASESDRSATRIFGQ